MAGSSGPHLSHTQRGELGAAFQSGGRHYHAVRPDYPPASLQWLAEHPVHDALDIGAGTGKYTQLLVAQGWRVTAVDPSADMLAQLHAHLPTVHLVAGRAEELPLPAAGMDLVVVAQAWHWCEPLAASREIARVLRPGGTLGLVWNQLDVAVPWVHRLARIMHAGDVHKSDFRPALGAEFAAPQVQESRWEQTSSPEELLELVKSRSYYLRSSPAIRAKVTENLRWYLFEHLGHTPGGPLQLPYVTQSWRARLR